MVADVTPAAGDLEPDEIVDRGGGGAGGVDQRRDHVEDLGRDAPGRAHAGEIRVFVDADAIAGDAGAGFVHRVLFAAYIGRGAAKGQRGGWIAGGAPLYRQAMAEGEGAMGNPRAAMLVIGTKSCRGGRGIRTCTTWPGN